MARDPDKERAHQSRNRRRARIVELARDIARSGRHADHAGVIGELEAMSEVLEGLSAARARLEDPAFRAQLDRLCAMVQAGTTPTTRRA